MSKRSKMQLSDIVGAIGDYTDDCILITEAEPIDEPGPRIVWANKAFTTMTGYALEEVLGKTPRILQGPETSKLACAKIRQSLQNWEPIRIELKNYHKDGTPFWVDLSIRPVADDTGWYRFWVSVQRETTRKNEREQLLFETTQILDAAPIALGLLGSDNRVTYANEAFQTLLFGKGLRPPMQLPYSAWLKHSSFQLAESGDAKFDASVWQEKHLAGLFSQPFKVEQQINGVWYEFRKTSTDQGRQLIIGEDVEQRISLHRQIQQASKLEAMGQLTSGVAHDFNNLLAVILGNLELLQDGAPGDNEDELILNAINAVQKGRALTQSLSSFARKSALSPEPTDINEAVAEAVQMFKRTAPTSISIETDFQESRPFSLLDRNMFQNAVLNILINARDAMPAGGRLSVAVRKNRAHKELLLARKVSATDPLLEISVSDTGSGMDAATRRKAIEPFYTTKDAGRGSGLGLSMVHGFIQQSGGQLQIDSELGQGSIVRMFFPMETDVVNGTVAQPGSRKSPRLGLKIFLVEDDPDVRSVLKAMMEYAGCRVDCSESGDAALLRSHEWPGFDMLVTDQMMPGSLQGDALAELFREACPQLPILLLTGNPELAKDTRVKDLSRCGVLAKPVERKVLLDTLRAVTETSIDCPDKHDR